jgi:di/tricarboxylate transporter
MHPGGALAAAVTRIEQGYRLMTTEQAVVFGTLIAALVLFVRGTWRYDLVALMALLLLCITGIVPAERAFLGFGHPAVITVGAVLVISAAMRSAGVVDALGALVSHLGNRPGVHVVAMTFVVAVCSGFMNNVGALAILMPVAIHLARSSGRSPSYLLMPLAFGSLLGGLTTLIGTPPNIIIATFRADVNGDPFGMFDFAWVGVPVALAGVLFIGLIGWRLIPQRQGEASVEELFEIDTYTAELGVPKESKAVDRTIREIGQAVDADYTIVGLARGKRRISMPPSYQPLSAGDVLLIEGDAESIKALSDKLGLELVGDKKLRDELLKSDSVEVMEAIVKPESYIERRTAGQLNLRRRFGVNLLGVARQGQRLKQRLRDVRLRAGDILLLQGDSPALHQALTDLGLLPLAVRGLKIGRPPRVIFAVALFGAALALTTASVLPVQIALSCCAAAMVLMKMLTLREAYASVDWSIIVLLGALIPVGEAMETTGGAQLIAEWLRSIAGDLPPAVGIAALIVVTAILSDIINNAAAAVLMAPIAIRLAEGLSASADPFLMAVAFGASSAFNTPIGHQSNTLVMGPGGYRFGDYIRLGLPVSLLTWGVGVPLILLFWPLFPGSR